MTIQTVAGPNPTPAAANLKGEWKLVGVSGGIAGINDNFPDGQLTSKINHAKQHRDRQQ